MATEKMIIKIDAEGNVSVDLEGMVGKGCHAVQEAMGKVLGTTTSETTKPEYYKEGTKQNTVQNRG